MNEVFKQKLRMALVIHLTTEADRHRMSNKLPSTPAINIEDARFWLDYHHYGKLCNVCSSHAFYLQGNRVPGLLVVSWAPSCVVQELSWVYGPFVLPWDLFLMEQLTDIVPVTIPQRGTLIVNRPFRVNALAGFVCYRPVIALRKEGSQLNSGSLGNLAFTNDQWSWLLQSKSLLVHGQK